MKTNMLVMGLILSVFFGTAHVVSAEQELTPVVPSGNVSDISGMTLAQLQELVLKLQKQLAEKKTGVNSGKMTDKKAPILDAKKALGVTPEMALKKRLEIKTELTKGGSGEEVRLLQRILATDPSVYPEGIASGFFGELTSKALSRLQTKFGLQVTGTMNPETRDLINKILESEGASDDVPALLLAKPGLRERVKMEWKFNNGVLERVIRIESKEDSFNDAKLEIEVETKFKSTKVKVEYKDKKSTYLFQTKDMDVVVEKLASKLGLSEEVIRSAMNIEDDSEDDSNDDSSNDDSSDDSEDGEDDNGGDDN